LFFRYSTTASAWSAGMPGGTLIGICGACWCWGGGRGGGPQSAMRRDTGAFSGERQESWHRSPNGCSEDDVNFYEIT
jgi:hypothetical protein